MISQFFAISVMAMGIAFVGSEIVMEGRSVTAKLIGAVAILGAAYGLAISAKALMGV